MFVGLSTTWPGASVLVEGVPSQEMPVVEHPLGEDLATSVETQDQLSPF